MRHCPRTLAALSGVPHETDSAAAAAALDTGLLEGAHSDMERVWSTEHANSLPMRRATDTDNGRLSTPNHAKWLEEKSGGVTVKCRMWRAVPGQGRRRCSGKRQRLQPPVSTLMHVLTADPGLSRLTALRLSAAVPLLT